MQRKPDLALVTSTSPLPGADNGSNPFLVSIWGTEVMFGPHEPPAVVGGVTSWFGTISEDIPCSGVTWTAGTYVVLRGKHAYAFLADETGSWDLYVMVAAYRGFSIGMRF